jgi:polyisoprenoid-binding protein YceI
MAIATVTAEPQQLLDTATTWRIDPAASRVEFTVRQHLPFVKRLTAIGRTVVGHFAAVSGTIVLEERRPATARVEIVIGAAGVDTGLAQRDDHLRSAAFFDVARHPTLTFTSRMVEEVDRADGRYRVMGDLTIRGMTRAVRLDLHFGREPGSAGRPRLVLTAATVLNRRDYGLNWNGMLLRVADDVAVTLVIRAEPAERASE